MRLNQNNKKLLSTSTFAFLLVCMMVLPGCKVFEKFSKFSAPQNAELMAVASADQPTRMRVSNQCDEPIWVDYGIGSGVNIGDGLHNRKLNTGDSFDYPMPDTEVAAVRFWPKIGCDDNGMNCDIGQSSGDCGNKGCQPPVDSKFEATFADAKACVGKSDAKCVTWYNASQVDGYTLPYAIYPKGNKENTNGCEVSRCDIDANTCPSDEIINGKPYDLKLRGKSGKVVGCIAPCKRLNYPAPYGDGIAESSDEAKYMCCPTPPIDPGQCTSGPIEKTKYVNHIRQVCHNVYTYAYDDANGLHTCSATTKFEVVFCPKGGPASGTKVSSSSNPYDGSGTAQAPSSPPATQSTPAPTSSTPASSSSNVCDTDDRVNKSVPHHFDNDCLTTGGAGCITGLPCRYNQ